MRAFVITEPGRGGVEDVEPPTAAPGHVVVDVERAGVCGTDVEFFTGAMAYLHQGHARYPMRPGHEWCGVVTALGDGVERGWLGQRVTADTMLGCGRCRRCRAWRHHVCDDRFEIGVRGGWHGALAEQLTVPAGALHPLPAAVDATAGALVEPGGNALRAVEAAALAPGERLLVAGPGTIGLLAAAFALARGAEVHVLGVTEPSLAFARTLGVHGAWTAENLPDDQPYDAVIDASTARELPARALDLVEPGRRVVCIGLAARPSTVDTRTLVLRDVTAVGILGASAGLAPAIAAYASGAVDPRPLMAATRGLDAAADILAGTRPPGAGPGPKFHIDPRA
ncbi:alcohol dehydrogenase catalytic domain-containing protein [Streptomyces sp. B6B3]|uniref:zinc-dependent alcohol dehydrogenase n=1 Tax=Streptomyces sp. B6B3 TaxID=3153570 RepID=UPI00325EC407